MTSLIKLILERDYERKDSIKKTYHTYSCYFIVKFKKKINRTQMVERIRGIKSVTIVDLRGDEKLEKINRGLADYEYSTVEVKFVTNKDPKEQAEYIRKAMVGSDKKNDIDNIIGIVGASAKLETLIKKD
jgi:hypothetical protein